MGEGGWPTSAASANNSVGDLGRADGEEAQVKNDEPGFVAIPNMPVTLIEPRIATDFGLQVSADPVGNAKARKNVMGALIESVGANLSTGPASRSSSSTPAWTLLTLPSRPRR